MCCVHCSVELIRVRLWCVNAPITSVMVNTHMKQMKIVAVPSKSRWELSARGLTVCDRGSN